MAYDKGSAAEFADNANNDRLSFLSKRGISAGDAGGMGATDYAGIGLQVLGALQKDREKKDEEERQNKKDQDMLRRLAMQRADSLKQQEVENQMAKRGQNQRGLEYVTGLVDSNTAEGRRSVPNFRTALLSGGRI